MLDRSSAYSGKTWTAKVAAPYAAGANHDPDGDSTGTAITVL